MGNKAYLEITNVCNLSCSFCHGTKRAARFMNEEEFALAATRLRPFCEYLYFHLMGEPLLHPLLGRFMDIAGELGFKVILTTNGTLLYERREGLLGAGSLHKISISLHAYEANALPYPLEEYLQNSFDFAADSAAAGIITVLRLWNIGGKEELNGRILGMTEDRFGVLPEAASREKSYKLRERLYLEWGESFEWPDMSAPDMGGRIACYGLRNQVGVLCDGTVVPCCLDAEGQIALGNIYDAPLEEILCSDRAVCLKTSFENRRVTEPLCLRCGFAHTRLPRK